MKILKNVCFLMLVAMAGVLMSFSDSEIHDNSIQVSVSFKKKIGPSGFYVCIPTFSVVTPNSVKYDWELYEWGHLSKKNYGAGKKWTLGYIEPFNPYKLRVRAVGSNNWVTKEIEFPHDCGVK